MTKSIAACCLLITLAIASASVFAQKTAITRQLGGACGEDANTVATCDVGLTCKDGYCAMRSFLSGATVSCKSEMAKAGVGSRELVSVHDGFCYYGCSGMYEEAMRASAVTERLLTQASAGSEAFGAELAKLSDEEKASFKRADDKCNSCGKYCTIGAAFLGRGGY